MSDGSGMGRDALEYRVEQLEKKVGNGGDGLFVRRETLDLVLDPIKDDVREIKTSIVGARSEQASNFRTTRNIVIGALVSGIVSIIVAILVAAILS